MAADPLTYEEQYELHRLRWLEPPSDAPPSREELERLRAALRRELEELRARTAQFPCSPDVDALEEVNWRRLLPKAKTDGDVPGESLTYEDEHELHRLRWLEPSDAPPSRDELHRLRAALRRELDELRIRTARFSCSPDVDALEELHWRRLLPKANTDEEVRAKAAREEQEERRRRSTWESTQHNTLNAAESEMYARILRDPNYHPGGEDPPGDLVFSVKGDCGKKHSSTLRAIACFLVRDEQETRRAEGRKPRPASTRSTLPRLERPPGTAFPSVSQAPSSTSTSPRSASTDSAPARLERPSGTAFPGVSRAPSSASTSPRPASTDSAPTRTAATTMPDSTGSASRGTRAWARTSTSARPASTPRLARPASTNSALNGASTPTRTSTPATSTSARPASTSSAPNGTSTPTMTWTPAMATSAPLGRPLSPSTPPVLDRTAALERRILDAVSSQDLGSYRAILSAVGGRRAVALAAIQAMHDNGRISLVRGVFRPGAESGKRVPPRG